MRLRFGLAAWSNSHFDNALYPIGTKHDEYLPRYAGMFDSAEADVLHHRAADEGTLQDWVAQTPKGFLFLPKMHKDATHRPTMRGSGRAGARYAWLHPQLPEDPLVMTSQGEKDRAIVDNFLASVDILRRGNRLGPVLLQFGPSLEREAGLDRLAGMLSLAPPGTFAVELRHNSWFVPATENLLEDFEAPLVWSTFPTAFAPPWRTADYGYIRFTGKNMHKRGRHVTVADRSAEVAKVAKRLRDAPWKECFVIVTNPFEGNAVDSMPGIAEALGADVFAKRLRARAPGQPLFPEPSAKPAKKR